MKNKTMGFWLGIFVWVGLLVFSPMSTRAFALLGPVQPWMQATNGVVYPDDIGGPMELTNEYRWNVPVVTYGFDQSFLDFFGSNGVAAVEGAIQILNDLPPASQIVLTNYPLDSRQANYAVQAQSLLDLKSETLSLLLQQLGLAQPTRNVYVLKQWDPVLADYSGVLLYDVFDGTNLSNYVVTRNCDPQGLEASPYVNQILYSGEILSSDNQHAIAPYSVDPSAPVHSAVADASLSPGEYYTGLTRDDIGGLRYLLSTNNVNYETLLSDVQAVGTNFFVNGAWRPGVDKITYIPQQKDSTSGDFLPTTNYFTVNYISNGIVIQQHLVRIVKQPDFLFSAGDVNFGRSSLYIYERTGTTNWINSATLNGNPAGAGPGIIRPPVNIIFQKLGNDFYNLEVFDPSNAWSEDAVQDLTSEFGTYGSFDGTTNASIVYPIPQTGNVSLTVQMLLRHSNYGANFHTIDWRPTSQVGSVYAFQTSTNLSVWNTLFTLTNNGCVCTYQNVNANSLSRFYRLIPQ